MERTHERKEHQPVISNYPSHQVAGVKPQPHDDCGDGCLGPPESEQHRPSVLARNVDGGGCHLGPLLQIYEL